MKAYYLLFFGVTSLLNGQADAVADAEPAWKIEKLSIAPVKAGVGLLTASILRVSESRRFELSDNVTLVKMHDSYVWGDRLVLLGEAERASVVEIFDLARKAKLDWFVCYGPRRISDNWIAYTEFYHGAAQGPGVTTDVLLVYDLARTPLENRMEKVFGQKIPSAMSGGGDNVIHVGTPVYPEFNARLRSYQIIRETEGAGRGIDTQTLALLPSKQLVFKSVEMLPGMGAVGSSEYLVVVDLSQGLEKPPSRTVHFPKMGEYGTNIERIEAASPTAVRLVFPAGEYAVDSQVVELPVF